MGKVVYHPCYNIGFFGVERLHPFDSRKYGRAAKAIQGHFGERWRDVWIRTDRQASVDELLSVHSREYLRQLTSAAYVATALELPVLRLAPGWFIDWRVLRSMRWAVRGTILAAKAALTEGFACNLAGGYHHAKPSQGEGFCIYSDIGIAVSTLRQRKLIDEQARIAYIDLDAHQGNGVCHFFRDDPRVFIFDAYNPSIYPYQDREARSRIDCKVPLPDACGDREYLSLLHTRLPSFLDSIGQSAPLALAVYNAGTDVFAGDPLGNLNLSEDGILERDLFVVEECRRRKIPTVMLPSGGYTRTSYRLMARSIIELIERY